jgi:hypothetical protein
LPADDDDAAGGADITGSQIWLSSSGTYSNTTTSWKMLPADKTTHGATVTCIDD